MRANKLLPLTLLLVVAGGACKKDAETNVTKKIDANTVQIEQLEALKLVKIEKTQFPETMEVNGKVSIPDKDIVIITARVQGRLESLPVQVGDKVRLGQSLGLLWSSDLLTAVEEYKMAQTQKDQELIELSHSKLRAMGISPGDIGAKSGFPLRAPIEGVVLDKKLNAGSAVNVGDTILTLGKNTTLQFSAEVPPELALKLHSGMKVRFPEREDSTTASIVNVSPVSDPVTNLVKVRCQFDGETPKGIPQESYLKAEIILSVSDSLVAPTKALLLTNDGERVFLQDLHNPHLFKRVPITVKSRNKLQLNVETSPEITEGSQVVGDGALLLEGVLEGDE